MPEKEQLEKYSFIGENYFILAWACDLNGDTAAALKAIELYLAGRWRQTAAGLGQKGRLFFLYSAIQFFLQAVIFF